MINDALQRMESRSDRLFGGGLSLDEYVAFTTFMSITLGNILYFTHVVVCKYSFLFARTLYFNCKLVFVVTN